VEPNVQVYWLPKEGYTAEEYEDAYGCDEESGLYAVADGATESSFAEIWSAVLTRQFVLAPPEGSPPSSDTLRDWVFPLQQEWHANIGWGNLPWYAEEKARKGAFATFLGMRFGGNGGSVQGKSFEDSSVMDKIFFMFKKQDGGGNTEGGANVWEAITIGDSNMYQIRNNDLLRSWPIEKAVDFDSRPLLLSSNPKFNDDSVWEAFKYVRGDYQKGDLFILATDAIAKWFLDSYEKGKKPWNTLKSIKDDSEYRDFVGKLRKSKQMRNDDTTYVMLDWK